MDTQIKTKKPGQGSTSSSTRPVSVQGSTSSSTWPNTGSGLPSGSTRPSKTASRNARSKAAKNARQTIATPLSGSYVVTKRPRMEDSNPSPESRQNAPKRAKEGTLWSYSEAASVTRKAIIKDGFPVAKIAEVEIEALQQAILKRIDGIPAGYPLPLIKNFQLSGGAMINLCGDAQTGKWLKGEFDQNEQVLEG